MTKKDFEMLQTGCRRGCGKATFASVRIMLLKSNCYKVGEKIAFEAKYERFLSLIEAGGKFIDVFKTFHSSGKISNRRFVLLVSSIKKSGNKCSFIYELVEVS
ncbi:hypothetical protein KAI92_00220 [Candidatus Parcubacteria bacterium]|nr:hypothetical protein [Candidatus Parcubacteria bacterium]